MNNITTKLFELYNQSPTVITLVTFDSRLANKVNNLLNYYPDVSIKTGEEAKFNMSYLQFNTLRKSVVALRHVSIK